jgi:lipid-A-disaccharide synthase
MSRQPYIFILAGEPSGDMIGALLVRELKKLRPEAKIGGIGGDRMIEAGADIQFNIVRDLAIIGFIEPLKKYPQIRKLFQDTYQSFRENKPDVLVLIDYPGFNLRVAKQAHEQGIRTVYYVIPQVWAWHKSRVKIIRDCVDRVLPILPFEKPFLEAEGVPAEYAGHPLMDIMKLTMDREEVFARFGFRPEGRLIGLLPGSRNREVNALLPVMLDAAERIADAIPGAQFFLPKAPTLDDELIQRHLEKSRVEVKVLDSFRYNIRAAADFALVASGTATLETGLLGCPMAILYKVSPVTYFLGKRLSRVPYVGLINLVAEEKIVAEFLQHECTAENASEHAIRNLSDDDELSRTRSKLAQVREKIGGPGASLRVAEVVCEVADAAIAAGPDSDGGEG